MTALREQGVFPPIYVALMNARDAYLASANQFSKPSDRATLRKQCDLISQHMRQILNAEGDGGAVGGTDEQFNRFRLAYYGANWRPSLKASAARIKPSPSRCDLAG